MFYSVIVIMYLGRTHLNLLIKMILYQLNKLEQHVLCILYTFTGNIKLETDILLLLLSLRCNKTNPSLKNGHLKTR